MSDETTLYTWGDGLWVWDLRTFQARKLASGPFDEGGCLVDLDGDGVREFISVANQGKGLGTLVWRSPPAFLAEVVDTGVEMHDCMQADLFSRRGVLMIHRHMQVRFYERPPRTGEKWKSREIYSIYTPSKQAGLALHDVNGDGLLDIYCGNYWIRSPESFELPWRLFAINTYSEKPLSAMLSIAKADGDLVAAQSHLKSARVTWFEKPADPKLMWLDHRLSNDGHAVHGLVVTDLNGDGRLDVVAGERDGEGSRLLVFQNEGVHRFTRSEQPAGDEIVALFRLGNNGLLQVGRQSLTEWRARTAGKHPRR